MSTTTPQRRGQGPREAGQKDHGRRRGRGRRGVGPGAARTRRGYSLGTPAAWRAPVLALLDFAELEVIEHPEDRARVQAVRRALCARFDRQPLPPLEIGDLAFTFGLIATALGSQLSDRGLLSQCLRLLSPSAQAEYERATGLVRVGPPFRC